MSLLSAPDFIILIKLESSCAPLMVKLDYFEVIFK